MEERRGIAVVVKSGAEDLDIYDNVEDCDFSPFKSIHLTEDLFASIHSMKHFRPSSCVNAVSFAEDRANHIGPIEDGAFSRLLSGIGIVHVAYVSLVESGACNPEDSATTFFKRDEV